MVNMHVYYICPHRAIATKQGIITGPIMEKQGHYENEKQMDGMPIDYRIKRIFFGVY